MTKKVSPPGRRFLMQAGLAVLGTAAWPATAFARREDETVFLPQPLPPIPGAPCGLDRLQSIMERNDITLAVDPTHLDHTPYVYICSDQFLDLAKRAGITHIAVEIVSLAQPLIDNLAAEKISKEKFITDFYGPSNNKSLFETATEYGNYIATLVKNATTRGIKIIAADPSHSYTRMNTPTEARLMKAYQAVSRFDFILFHTTDFAGFVKNYLLENPKEIQSYWKEFDEFRSSLFANKAIVRLIDSHLDDNSKPVILFGGEHQKALQEIFQSRNKKTAAVAFYDNAASFIKIERANTDFDPHLLPSQYINNFFVKESRFADEPEPAKPQPHRGPQFKAR